MAIPVYLQQFKAAGIYRIVFDKSTVAGVDSEILRMVVGYSEKGPFNIPTYVTSISDFKAIYGDISKKLEKRGVFFHRPRKRRCLLHPRRSGNWRCLHQGLYNPAGVALHVGHPYGGAERTAGKDPDGEAGGGAGTVAASCGVNAAACGRH